MVMLLGLCIASLQLEHWRLDPTLESSGSRYLHDTGLWKSVPTAKMCGKLQERQIKWTCGGTLILIAAVLLSMARFALHSH